MNSIRLSVLFAFAALLPAQVRAPRIGFVRCPDRSVRAVYGLPASLVVSRSGWIESDAVASSGEGLLLSQDGVLRLLKSDGTLFGEVVTHDTAPVLGLSESLASAVAWLPSQQTVVYWNNTHAVQSSLESPLSGSVLSIRLVGQMAHLLVLEKGAVSEVVVDLRNGLVQSTNVLPGVQAPAIWAGSSILYARYGQLILARANGTEQQLALPLGSSGATFSSMDRDWIHVAAQDGKRNWAVHLDDTGPTLTEMPSLRAAAALSNAALSLEGGGR